MLWVKPILAGMNEMVGLVAHTKQRPTSEAQVGALKIKLLVHRK